MPLPTSRNTTYTANDPIKSNDLNAIQDSIVTIDASVGAINTEIADLNAIRNAIDTINNTTIPQNVKHGDITRFFPARTLIDGSLAENPWRGLSSLQLYLDGIEFEDSIKSITHVYSSSTSMEGASNYTFELRLVFLLSSAITITTIPGWTATVTGVAATDAVLTATVNNGGLPRVVGEYGAYVYAARTMGVGTGRYYGALVTWNHP